MDHSKTQGTESAVTSWVPMHSESQKTNHFRHESKCSTKSLKIQNFQTLCFEELFVTDQKKICISEIIILNASESMFK